MCNSHRTNPPSRTAADDEADDDVGRAPAVGRRLDDGVEQRGETDDRQDRAEGIEPRRRGILRCGDEHDAGDQTDDHDGHVHEEDRTPVEVLDEEAAGEGSEGAAQTGDAGPHADRPAALLGGEHVGDDRQGCRHDQRATDAHQGAGGDELVRRAGHGRQDRTQAEDGEARLQGAASTEAVTERAGRQQQTGEDQGVGVDHPLQLAVGCVQLADDGGDRHVQDRVVEHDDEQAEAENREDQPPPLVGAVFVLSHSGRLFLAARRSWLVQASPLRNGLVAFVGGYRRLGRPQPVGLNLWVQACRRS